MASKPPSSNPFIFRPVILDQDKHQKRRVIHTLPAVHQTETLQKFFGATVDHLFDPGNSRPVNGFIGQRPLWYDPDQDYYIGENTSEREFYQLEPAMVSKGEGAEVTNLLFYPDLINQLRFQGGLVDNENRLFEQDVYTWAPPVDLDKVINFRQYVWLPVSEMVEVDESNVPTGGKYALEVMGPKSTAIADGVEDRFYLPGYSDDSAFTGPEAAFYDLAVTKTVHLTVKVDGTPVAFSYTQATNSSPGLKFVELAAPPPLNAIVEIWVYSDFENNVLGQESVDPMALGGHQLSSGQRIQILNDKNTDFKPDKVYIVEGVGTGIVLLEETPSRFSNQEAAEPDYMVMTRGCNNGNPWSLDNRWFHISTISPKLDPDYVYSKRAIRPILEYTKDLELFNYGLARRSNVDVLVDVQLEGIADIVAYLAANPTSVTFDGVQISTAANGEVAINGSDPVPGARLLIINTNDPDINDRVYALTNQANVLSLVLETSGFDPSGAPAFGEIVKINYGSKSQVEYYWDGARWSTSQAKLAPNTVPLFALYDMDGVDLSDQNSYPGSSFKGSRVFSYQENLSEFAIPDSILGIPVSYDNKGDILFENYLGTERYTYIVAGQEKEIQGYYFHKIGNIDPSLETLSDDWYKVQSPSRQYVTDRFIADGSTRIFNISQEPGVPLPDAPSIEVWRGRIGSDGNFTRTLLEADNTYIRSGKKVLIPDVQKNDAIEIRTFNDRTPEENFSGHYEIPLNLRANPNNETVVAIGRGDFYAHFSNIIINQTNFEGAEYSINNWRDTAKDLSKGRQIVQHGSPLLKTMLLASESQLDLTAAIRFVDAEYTRFKDKFHQKILEYTQNNRFTESSTVDEWISTALSEINVGKTRDFAFAASPVGQTVGNSIPTFIPATPAFIGVYPLYVPELITTLVETEEGEEVEVTFVRGHDGSWLQAANSICGQIIFELERRIYDSIPVNIRNRERPHYDFEIYYGDQFRSNAYSWDEYLTLLRPSFERWAATFGIDYRRNDGFDANDPWTFNWSSSSTLTGEALPGHWRGIYQKFFGTQRPDLTPWEMLGFTNQPSWWESRYGPAPYTSNNDILWDDVEKGYIHAGSRAGIHPTWARPGVKDYIPVNDSGELLNPYEAGIATSLPLNQDAKKEWKWGDLGPVEQDWRRSSSFPFAVATAAYLMKPAMFVELGWDTEHLVKMFEGEPREQWINELTMNRPMNSELYVHGEFLEDQSLVVRVGIQQWISDLLTSRNSNITTAFGSKVRGLQTQLAYKVGGFTDGNNLRVSSDAFGRVPPEDISLNLFRSPSIKEETYSGIAIEWTGRGFRVYGYDPIKPYFNVIYGDDNGNQIKLGGTGRSDLVPSWRGEVYYTVNMTVQYNNKFYRCIKTHTALSTFEPNFWIEVARPQFADGSALLWYLEPQQPSTVEQVAYGTILRTPQDVANLMNGYDRYLTSRGWVFDQVSEDFDDLNSWRTALKSFIVWSQRDDLEAGDVIALSPASEKIVFTTSHGAVQPVEQIINGAYAIVDQLGRPIDAANTSVVRYDDEITITSSDDTAGIFGLRLYVSEFEHVMVFNNKTIFNDVIYDPLLNIQQPRLRIQGFRSVDWRGRIDAPGFIVSGTTLVPNFEKSADDFRRFFDVESIENKNLQDRARANLGYEEREYLNNLLLSPTSQFEFYQGMIQQKGSVTSMRRLLRSNFIRHNKGLQLFEEWAFRIGDYGGAATLSSLEVSVAQQDFKHNPQMFEFIQQDLNAPIFEPTPGITQFIDLLTPEGAISDLDNRWVYRPETVQISWPMRNDDSDTSKDLPTAGFVKLDEVKWTCPTRDDWNLLVLNQIRAGEPVENGDRVWYYGIDDFDAEWKTAKYHNTSIVIGSSTPLTRTGAQVAIISEGSIKEEGGGPVTTVSCNTDPSKFYLTLPSSYRTVDNVVSPEVIVFQNVVGPGLPEGEQAVPVFTGSASAEMTADLTNFDLLQLIPEAGMTISNIKIEVIEPFSEGAFIEVGTAEYPNELVKAQDNFIEYPEFDTDVPVQIVGAIRNEYHIGDADTTVGVELVRIGRSEPCDETTATWFYKRPSDAAFVSGGVLSYKTPVLSTNSDHYVQEVQVPLDAVDNQVIEIRVVTDGTTPLIDEFSILVLRPAESSGRFVELTSIVTQEFNCDTDSSGLYPYVTQEVRGTTLTANLFAPDNTGRLRITVDYFYTNGFEVYTFVNGVLGPLFTPEDSDGADVFTWIPTSFDTFEYSDDGDSTNDTVPSGVWSVGDIIEVKTFTESQGGNGGWAVLQFNGSTWEPIRVENKKIDSEILTSAAVYDSRQNELIMLLQLYDPMKGSIPGVADKELYYKGRTDPAVYAPSGPLDSATLWGPEQVGRLWWDLSTIRYLDYEIYDDLSGGVEYRWKNWGRIAPGTFVDIYEWVRSPVAPNQWSEYVRTQGQNTNTKIKPTGQVVDPEAASFVQRTEWNSQLAREESVFYFWVKDVTTVPLTKARSLSAVQVANIITNPTANDIPYFAVIDHNRMILGGVRQFVADEDTVLKVKWKYSPDSDTPHHKEWLLLREQDERNTIDDRLWDKMRDTLVGWDTSVDEQGQSAPKEVPDPKLPRPQQLGNLVRPRQAWFASELVSNAGYRPSRYAREQFITALNNIMYREPYSNIWFDWRDVFEVGEDLPSENAYDAEALDIADMQLMISPTVNSIVPGEKVLIRNTVEVNGFWTLWECIEENGIRDFTLVDFQKWKMQDGDLWESIDWYAEGWSARDFPAFRYPDLTTRDLNRPVDFTLLRGTLVQVNNTSGNDGLWTWYSYNENGFREVGRKDGTFRLSSAFYDQNRQKLGPAEVTAILDSDIRPNNVRTTLGAVVANRDGSRELQHLIESLRTKLLSTLQKNELFFTMVKSAFKVNRTVDWAFKTSFLYLGGYSEDLRQSPVAFKDQVDNVVAYLEEVKPYHVKIREYVRRLSYGPDIGNFIVTDFDKPVYLDRTLNPPAYRRLNPAVAADVSLMSTTRVWQDWFDNHQKTNYDLTNWDANWNPIRRSRVQVSFDRVSCSAIRGWDVTPWDAPTLLYSQNGDTVQSLSDLSFKYRNEFLWDETTQNHDPSKPHKDYYFTTGNRYGDTAVETINQRNELVRQGRVTPNNQGAIVTVRRDRTHWMWTGRGWIQFSAPGWDSDTESGAVARVEEAYFPLPGMPQRNDPSLISGCDFGGTQLLGTFQNGAWDMFEWDEHGWSSELADRVGIDPVKIDGNAGAQLPEDINIEGNKFSSPAIDGKHPEEQVFIPGRDGVIITVIRNEGSESLGDSGEYPILRYTKDLTEKWMYRDLCSTEASLVAWDQINKTLTIDTPTGEFPFHDPSNPSSEFLANLKLNFGYYSASSNNMTLGSKSFQIRSAEQVAEFGIPSGLMGDGVRVVMINSLDSSLKMVGTINWGTNPAGNELSTWNGTITVDVDGYVGTAPATPATSYDTWDIIPLESYDQPGVIWIGTARFTYKSVVPGTGNQFILQSAYANPWSLAGIDIAADMSSISLDTSKPVYNGLCFNQ